MSIKKPKETDVPGTVSVVPTAETIALTGALATRVEGDLRGTLAADVYHPEYFNERVLPRPKEIDPKEHDPEIELSKYAQMHLRSPKSAQHIVDAVRDAQGNRILRPSGYLSYAKNQGDAGMPEVDPETAKTTCEAVRAWFKQEHGCEVNPQWMVLCTGAVKGYRALVKCKREGDARPTKIATIAPTFHRFVEDADKHKGIVYLEDNPDTGWKLDIAALSSKLEGRDFTHLLLCNPNNPTGTVYTPKELDSIVRVCKQNNVTLVSDEIWSDLILDENARFTPAMTAAKNHQYLNGTVTIYGAGKAFNISGFSCNIAIIPDPKLRAEFEKIAQKPSKIACEMTTACLNEGRPYLAALKPYLRKNAERAAAGLNAAGFPTRVPQSTFMLYSKTGGSEEAKTRLRAAKIETHHLPFGNDQYERVTVGEPYDTVDKCFTNLETGKTA